MFFLFFIAKRPESLTFDVRRTGLNINATKHCRNKPRKIVTDKLRNYNVSQRELVPDAIHDNSQYANNRAELSHQQTRVRERGMRRFKSIDQAQRYLDVHAAASNLSNLGRHLVSASDYRDLRQGAFASWEKVTVA